jgi:hypothetical protein
MAAKKTAKAGAHGITKSAYIRKYPNLSPKELSEQAKRDGFDIPPKIVSITRSQDKRKAGGSVPKPEKSGPRPKAGGLLGSGRSLADLLSDPKEVARARAAIEAEIKELEATIQSRKNTLKILTAAGQG